MTAKKKFMETLGYRSYNFQQRESKALVLATSGGPQPSTPSGRIAPGIVCVLLVSRLEAHLVEEKPIPDSYLAAHARWARTVSEQTAKRLGDIRPCSMLLEALAPLPSSGTDELGYRNLLSAVSYATGDGTQPRPRGFFSALQFKQDVAADVLGERRRELSLGLKSFFERQFEDFARNHVQQGLSLNRIALPAATQGESRKQLIKAFVQYMYRSNRFSELCMSSAYEDVVGDKQSVLILWPLIYFSMRMGAIEIARDEIDICVSRGMRGIDASVVILVATLGGLMSPSKGEKVYNVSVSELDVYIVSPPHNFIDAVRESRATYQLLKSDAKSDPYKLAVLNLLSSADPGAVAVPDSNLEDFLWGQLWCILTSGVVDVF